jgi:hypothetical protein
MNAAGVLLQPHKQDPMGVGFHRTVRTGAGAWRQGATLLQGSAQLPLPSVARLVSQEAFFFDGNGTVCFAYECSVLSVSNSQSSGHPMIPHFSQITAILTQLATALSSMLCTPIKTRYRELRHGHLIPSNSWASVCSSESVECLRFARSTYQIAQLVISAAVKAKG